MTTERNKSTITVTIGWNLGKKGWLVDINPDNHQTKFAVELSKTNARELLSGDELIMGWDYNKAGLPFMGKIMYVAKEEDGRQ